MPIPFGQTVRVWRLHRGRTQEQLAHAAGVPRPNLSAIERGKREVSLSTLRALALALEIRPGVLADGLPPSLPGRPARLSREALERIAEAAVRGTAVADPAERALAHLLRVLTIRRRRVATGRGAAERGQRRAMDAAWLTVRATCPPAVLRSLLERIDDRSRFDAPQAD